jgi:hypothetical protein
MIKMHTAFTEEIDDVEIAVSELLEQMDLDSCLLTNSVGLVHCYKDFLDSGVVAELCSRLPFDVVGCTTMSVSTSRGMGQMALTLTVLTSDDIRFAAGISEPIAEDMSGPVTEVYERVVSGQPQKPAMLMPFIPFMISVGGDEFIEKIDELSGGLPAFGTLSISNEPDYSGTFIIYNGEGYDASLALLALFGDVNPTFLSVSVTDENILKQKAVVTGVNRNILQTVNNMPTVKYLESIGLSESGGVDGLESMPFIAYLEDGSRLIRACLGSTEDGSVILCGGIPVNSTLALATMGPDDVVKSTEAKISEALESTNGRNLVMYSCAARYWALGMRRMAEHEKARECIGDAAPYHLAYSGGEIFPVFLDDGRIVNHLQNDSMIMCIL